jgi:hypothetical protein
MTLRPFDFCNPLWRRATEWRRRHVKPGWCSEETIMAKFAEEELQRQRENFRRQNYRLRRQLEQTQDAMKALRLAFPKKAR